jgi:hypothetical protein
LLPRPHSRARLARRRGPGGPLDRVGPSAVPCVFWRLKNELTSTEESLAHCDVSADVSSESLISLVLAPCHRSCLTTMRTSSFRPSTAPPWSNWRDQLNDEPLRLLLGCSLLVRVAYGHLAAFTAAGCCCYLPVRARCCCTVIAPPCLAAPRCGGPGPPCPRTPRS